MVANFRVTGDADSEFVVVRVLRRERGVNPMCIVGHEVFRFYDNESEARACVDKSNNVELRLFRRVREGA